MREALVDGPLTSAELTAMFPGADHRTVAASLSAQRRAKVKLVRICGYTREDPLNPKARTHPRAIYALGSEPDAPPPAPQKNKFVTRRYRAKVRARNPKPKVNSVWALGAAA